MHFDYLRAYIQDLSKLSEESFLLLLNACSVQHFRQGDLLLKEGEVCSKIFFIVKGYCRSFYRREGNDSTSHLHLANDFATNTRSLVTGAKSSYFIIAGQAVETVVVEKSVLLELYKQSTEIESFGRKLLEQLIIKEEEHSVLFKIFSPAERYDYLVRHYPAIIRQVPLTHIASYLGMARESLSRIRSKKQ